MDEEKRNITPIGPLKEQIEDVLKGLKLNQQRQQAGADDLVQNVRQDQRQIEEQEQLFQSQQQLSALEIEQLGHEAALEDQAWANYEAERARFWQDLVSAGFIVLGALGLVKVLLWVFHKKPAPAPAPALAPVPRPEVQP